ncbi:MAG: hypothetical protein QM813_16970 [Verrucomicrobiota bacterium]
MTLLSVCQAVAGNAGFAVPSTIVGNTDDTAVILLRLANRAGMTLARKPWSELQTEYAFSTVASTASYALPSDYGWFINDTAWDRTNYWNIRGSLSPQMWQIYKSGLAAASPRSRFRVKLGRLYIDPTPSSTVSMVIEYVSNKWVTDGVTTYTSYTADSQTSIFDEYAIELDLTWRFLARKGLAYAEEKAEAEREIDKIIGRNTPSNSMNMAGVRTPWPPMPTVPITGYS